MNRLKDCCLSEWPWWWLFHNETTDKNQQIPQNNLGVELLWLKVVYKGINLRNTTVISLFFAKSNQKITYQQAQLFHYYPISFVILRNLQLWRLMRLWPNAVVRRLLDAGSQTLITSNSSHNFTQCDTHRVFAKHQAHCYGNQPKMFEHIYGKKSAFLHIRWQSFGLTHLTVDVWHVCCELSNELMLTRPKTP